MVAKKAKTEGEGSVLKRLDRLEKAMTHFSDGLLKLSSEVFINRAGKNNPERKRLERRVLDLENKFFAFQCGAQAQMGRDRKAADLERLEEDEKKTMAIREALGARGAN